MFPLQSPLSPMQTNCPADIRASLYVGDLDREVSEQQLQDLFSQIGNLISIKVCRDRFSGTFLGYAYVNYQTPQEAHLALLKFNFTSINGKQIRIMFQQRYPNSFRNCHSNLLIKNLHSRIQNGNLHEIFSSFGTIVSCKVARHINGKSKGYGFVQYVNEEEARNAITQLNGMLFDGRKVYVGLFEPREVRDRLSGSMKFTNVYIKNLSQSFTKDDLISVFKQCGSISSAVIMTDEKGKSKCFGFVNFERAEDALSAVEKFNTHVDGDRVWYVGRAQNKSEREAKLKQERRKRFQELQESNLYVKNLDSTCNDEKLRQMFSQFGDIKSSKVAVDAKGDTKGFGFVAFSSKEKATKALKEMNGKMIGNKPLYVAIAERKDERRERMKVYFAQIRASSVLARTVPIIPSHNNAPMLPPNVLIPYNIHIQGQPGQMIHMYQPVFQNNFDRGLNHMTNAHPNGLMSHIMSSQFNLNRMSPGPWM